MMMAQQAGIKMADNKVRVIVECQPGQIEQGAELLRAVGEVEAKYEDMVQVLLPANTLNALAENPAVKYIQLPYQPVPAAIVSEGVALIGADDWQTAGYNGSGVKIAILDTGFQGYAALLGTELPASVTIQSFSADINGGGQVHGTACAEIVYDVAPGAQLFLVNYSTLVEFGNAVDWLITQDVDIISSSVGWPAVGPGDGTGPVNDIVAKAKTAGILWVQSAGNNAQSHWSGLFNDGNGNNWNDFSTSPLDEGNTITVSAGQQIVGALTWNDPWGSSVNDYDLLLINTNNQIVAGSTNTQSGTDIPYEALSYTATYTGEYYLAIGKKDGAATRLLQLFSSHAFQYRVAERSIVVPGDSPNVMTVGAVYWNTPSTIESFSSQGPTKDNKIKPDVVAPDGVSTVSYGTGAFYGTSASTPLVAGTSAVVKSRFNAYTRDQIYSVVKENATDLGITGKDSTFGKGFLHLCSLIEPPPGFGKIIFRSERDSIGRIYIMNPDGTQQVRISDSVYDTSPVWSPDGTKVAFLSYRDNEDALYVMNSNGSNVVMLAKVANFLEPNKPSWSPDGTKIAFIDHLDGDQNDEIYVVNVLGGVKHKLTGSIGYDDSPVWSPDGKKIAFHGSGGSPPWSDIFVANVDGSGLVKITSSGQNAYPTWASDGSCIAFTEFSDNYAADIYTILPDGNNLMRLTNTSFVAESSPVFSPDGTKIAYIRYDAYEGSNGNADIAVMNYDGTAQTRLTTYPEEETEPTWSSDGAKIAFVSDKDGNDEIYIMSVDGSNKTRLTNNSDIDRYLSWCPFAPIVPISLTTNIANSITVNSAQLVGTLVSLGNVSSANVSFEWGLTDNYENATSPQTKTSTGAFNAMISGLTPNTTYHFRAKAVGEGTSYGEDKTFTTLSTPPTVTTGNAVPSFTSAQLQGNVTNLGTATSVTTKIAWGTSESSLPNVIDCQTRTSTGSFTGNITGLSPAVTYYYRAEATGHGTGQGTMKSFTTPSTPPTVGTDNASNVGHLSARLNGNLEVMGTAPTVNVSFQWGTTHGSYNPETAIKPLSSAGTFFFDLIGLSANTTYYYRAKAVGHGTVYGEEKTFTTLAGGEIPAGVTDNATNITYNAARLNGTITAMGTVPTVQAYFAWGTAPGTYTRTSQPTNISAAGPVFFDASGLSASTTYYYRAYIAYSFNPGDDGEIAAEPECSFTTSAAPPPPPSGGFGGGFSGGGGAPSGPGITNLTLYTNSEGLFVLDGKAKSEDGFVNIDIAKGVLAQTKDKTQLKSIKIVAVDSPAELPSGFLLVGKVFEITPDGATFTPGITLTLTYDAAETPEGTDINSLSIMVYNPATSKWESLASILDKAKSSVSTTIEHFSIYTLASKKTVPPPTTPVYIPLPAKFSIANISIDPATGTISSASNNIVIVSTKVSNTGEKAGDYELVLKINGISEEARTVTVGAGASEVVSFTVSRSEPGEYEVEINGQKASFTVQETVPATTTPGIPVGPPPEKKGTNWGLIGLAAAGIAAVGVGVVLWLKRRTKEEIL